MTNNTELAWRWVQRQPSFTKEELAVATGLTLKQCSTIVYALKKRDDIKVISQEETTKRGPKPKRYAVVSQGRFAQSKRRHGDSQQRVWQSMRILRNFTYSDLVATAEVSKGIANSFCNLLMRFGYVRQIRANPTNLPVQERSGQYAVYRLVKDTGPIAPKRQDIFLFDANLKEYLHAVA
ncbi:hypothetical protein [Shewanella xiamenensis]|uniref:hypothetical protein n=1 Tax=Shewanella xiamenensis TaxID=332186 RepID=UPI00255AD347|nr:hypothetical protein [Shewanella xiamenensis]MDL3984612.1 hypothetical protein [Shewanella xiamenensis]